MTDRQDTILFKRLMEINKIDFCLRLKKERLQNFLKDLEQIEYLNTTGIRIKRIVERELGSIN